MSPFSIRQTPPGESRALHRGAAAKPGYVAEWSDGCLSRPRRDNSADLILHTSKGGHEVVGVLEL